MPDGKLDAPTAALLNTDNDLSNRIGAMLDIETLHVSSANYREARRDPANLPVRRREARMCSQSRPVREGERSR